MNKNNRNSITRGGRYKKTDLGVACPLKAERGKGAEDATKPSPNIHTSASTILFQARFPNYSLTTKSVTPTSELF